MISTPDPSVRQRGGLPAVIPARPGQTRKADTPERAALMPPEKRGFTGIPAHEVLEKLIARAVEAFKAGILWDRGSIVNIVV